MLILWLRWSGLAVALMGGIARGSTPFPFQDAKGTVTFNADIAPILQTKCQPCHFKGGKVFDHLPFDQYETVRKLGERLTTRLKGQDADLVTRWVKAGSPEK